MAWRVTVSAMALNRSAAIRLPGANALPPRPLQPACDQARKGKILAQTLDSSPNIEAARLRVLTSAMPRERLRFMTAW